MLTSELAHRILDRVQDAGATADLIIDEQESLSLKAADGDIEEHSVSTTSILGLRVIHNQRVGIAYSEASDEDALNILVQQALLNARFNSCNTHETIAPNRQTLKTDDHQLCPDADATVAERIDLALHLESTLCSLPHISTLPYNGVIEEINQRQLFSTEGLYANSRQRTNTVYAYALAAKDDQTAMVFAGNVARTSKQLAIDDIIEKIDKEAAAMLQGKPIPGSHYDVIFERDAQEQLFNVFAMCLSGKSVQQGLNPWAKQIGKNVASPLLQLSDKPLNSEGFNYRLFDDEGTACGDTAIIVDGILQTFLHNSVTASGLNATNTGHAQRGARSALSVSKHQLHIAPGNTSESELTAGTYVELTALDGIHSGANAVSGDFSFGASGFLCRDGERLQAVRGVTVAGNFYQMLKNIQAIGNTATWDWQRNSLMPLLRFTDIAISG